MEKQLVLPFSRTIREEFTDLHKDKHQDECGKDSRTSLIHKYRV